MCHQPPRRPPVSACIYEMAKLQAGSSLTGPDPFLLERVWPCKTKQEEVYILLYCVTQILALQCGLIGCGLGLVNSLIIGECNVSL